MIKLKIYLSPSDQLSNPYADGGTNEAQQCRRIAAACRTALERCGFEVKTSFADGENAMYDRVRESNAWGADPIARSTAYAKSSFTRYATQTPSASTASASSMTRRFLRDG